MQREWPWHCRVVSGRHKAAKLKEYTATALFVTPDTGKSQLAPAKAPLRSVIPTRVGAASSGSLPLFLRRKAADFPRDAYLKADPARVAAWRARLAEAEYAHGNRASANAERL